MTPMYQGEGAGPPAPVPAGAVLSLMEEPRRAGSTSQHRPPLRSLPLSLAGHSWLLEGKCC